MSEMDHDSVPARIRALDERVRDGKSLAIASSYVPEAIGWLVSQPAASVSAAASAIGESARSVRHALGGFFSGDMLESAERRSFLAGAIWVLIELSDAWDAAARRDLERSLGGTRAQQVLAEVKARLQAGVPLGAKEIREDPSLAALKARPDEVSRAFGTLLAQGVVRVVPGRDRRRRLFQYCAEPPARVSTVAPEAVMTEANQYLAQWQMKLHEPIDVSAELVGVNRGTATRGPELRIPTSSFFERVVGRPHTPNDGMPTICFAKDPLGTTMIVDMYVEGARDSIDLVLATLQTDHGDVSVALLRGTSHNDGVSQGFTGRVPIDREWPKVKGLCMRVYETL